MPEGGWPNGVGRDERRKLAARGPGVPGVWFHIGLFGMVGWSVALPTLLGALLGAWLDRHHPQRFSWTLSLMAVGLAAGCMAAWRWISRERGEIQNGGDPHA